MLGRCDPDDDDGNGLAGCVKQGAESIASSSYKVAGLNTSGTIDGSGNFEAGEVTYRYSSDIEKRLTD